MHQPNRSQSSSARWSSWAQQGKDGRWGLMLWLAVSWCNVRRFGSVILIHTSSTLCHEKAENHHWCDLLTMQSNFSFQKKAEFCKNPWLCGTENMMEKNLCLWLGFAVKLQNLLGRSLNLRPRRHFHLLPALVSFNHARGSFQFLNYDILHPTMTEIPQTSTKRFRLTFINLDRGGFFSNRTPDTSVNSHINQQGRVLASWFWKDLDHVVLVVRPVCVWCVMWRRWNNYSAGEDVR